MNQPTGACHYKDSRRPEGRKQKPNGFYMKQIPVICAVDVLDIVPQGATWTTDDGLVTCDECLSRLAVKL